MKKRVLGLLLALIMICGTISYIAPVEVQAAGLSVAQLQAKFPAGRYWNHTPGTSNNPDGTTGTPCPSHGSCTGTGSCGCNMYSGAIQCMGFAYKLGADAFGSSPRNWSKSYNINTVKPGDVIRYVTSAGNGHSVFVTGVTSTSVTFADCNYGNLCRIRWNVTVTKASLAATLQYIQVAPGTLNGGSGSGSTVTPTTTAPTAPTTTAAPSYDPEGDIDYINGKNHVIRYGGWAFDRSDLSKSAEVHVYIGGPAGSANAEGHVIVANQLREDIYKLYPEVGKYRGYEGTFYTAKSGVQPIYVYNINIGTGNTKMIWTENLNIPEDADYQPTQPTEPSTPSTGLKYKDIKTSDWYYEAVKYVTEKGIMTGMNETTFGPQGTVSRGQFAMILYRLAGSPAVSGSAGFTDVKGTEWYADAVNWAGINKIVTGYDDGRFVASKEISREQIATVLYRFASANGIHATGSLDALDKFADKDKVSEYAKEAMAWCVSNGIISGSDGGTKLNPTGKANRAEAATMIMRYDSKF